LGERGRERERLGLPNQKFREGVCAVGVLMFVRVAGVHKKLTGSFAVLWTQICGKFFFSPFFFLKTFLQS